MDTVVPVGVGVDPGEEIQLCFSSSRNLKLQVQGVTFDLTQETIIRLT